VQVAELVPEVAPAQRLGVNGLQMRTAGQRFQLANADVRAMDLRHQARYRKWAYGFGPYVFNQEIYKDTAIYYSDPETGEPSGSRRFGGGRGGNPTGEGGGGEEGGRKTQEHPPTSAGSGRERSEVEEHVERHAPEQDEGVILHEQSEHAEKPEECGAAHGALAMTTPGDTSMATLEEVMQVMKGGTARISR